MSKNTLLRLSAVTAIVGGALRVADSFITAVATVPIQRVAYFVTDLMLACGLCGIYLSRRNRLGLAGLLGFAASITGILMVRSFGQAAYLVGATVTLLGIVVISVAILARDAFPKSAPILWIASLIAGVIGLLPFGINWGVTVAGVIFGLGVIAAGISLFAGTET
jgi:hypothetical protein